MGLFAFGFSRVFVTASTIPLTVLIAAPPSAALADAATHDLSIKTKQYDQADCGGGTCAFECAVEAKLKISKFGPVKSAPIEVQIWYKTDHVNGGEAAISLAFGKLSKGKVGKAEGQAPGYRCSQVVVKRIVVECPQSADSRCPGFYYVQIPDVPSLKIKAQKIEGK